MSTPSGSPMTHRIPWLLAGALGCLSLCLIAVLIGGGAYFILGTRQPNRVSQNPGSAMPSLTPVLAPTGTIVPIATVAPASTQAGSPDKATLNLKPFCKCQQTVAEGQPLALRYGWLATSAQYVNDYVQASTRMVYIDGKRYNDLERYWQPTAYSTSDQGYAAYWTFPLPPLPPGMHTIETFVDVEREFTDGFNDKEGTLNHYGPWDSTQGHVDVLVGPSASVGGKCANGGPAGTFRYTMILPADYTSETWFDDEHKILKPGENVFYLSANQSHVQSAVGGHSFTMQEPECVTRTWRQQTPATLYVPTPEPLPTLRR